MALEPNVLKQLIATFKTELDEKLQIITDSLLKLEKNPTNGDSKKIIEEIFRSAHNIKGSSRSIGVINVGEIAHQIESIFILIREKKINISPDIITLCLTAVDAMYSAMQSFCDNKPLSFDLSELLNHLQQGIPLEANSTPKISKEHSNEDYDKFVEHQHNNYKTIRVALSQIDTVSALVEQLQITKISLVEHYSKLVKLTEKTKQFSKLILGNAEPMIEICYLVNQLYQTMHSSMTELELLTHSLQEEVRLLRLVPASTLLRHLTRSVRELANELNKKIEFEIRGDSVRLDKMILEGLKDPIIHLLRNAIDHGIEEPELRKQCGKSDVGKISIDVLDEGDHIVININDDGAGIDYKRIADFAEKRKFFAKSELDNMTEANVLELIFRPEFSTKEIITNVSGRGIGLDIAKANLTDLKGNISFTTEVGKGTTFHLQLPLTLSSDIGLTIQSGGQLFIIPVSAIEHVMLLPINEIYEVEANQIILFDQKPIPLRLLSDILNLEKKELAIPEQLPIVILKKGWDKIALLVEKIIGEREIVIKPLQSPLVNVPCVAGGTLSGTGDIIIVLNPRDIINSSIYSSCKTSWITSKTEEISVVAPHHHILLVDDSITTRTLEKNILENSNYKVSVAVDGKEAWDLLQKQTFSLVVTDIEMPNMNGFELTERIKKSDKFQYIPVVIVTSLGSEDQKRRGIDAGADAYIVKHNFESTELLAIVKQLV